MREISKASRPGPFAWAGWTIIGLLLIALNLRPAVTGLAPILTEVAKALNYSGTEIGILTTAPVICFGIIGPFAPGFARRWGMEKTVFVCLILLTIGTALRAVGGSTALFLGMTVIGLSVGVVNVLLPSLIKQDFPTRIGMMTGLYTGALCAGAAGAALLTPPIERFLGGGWQPALAIWAIPAAIAALLWLVQLVQSRPTGAHGGGLRHELWTDPLAWQVTIYLTLTTAFAYAIFGWGAKLLQDRGLSVDASAAQMALCYVLQAVGGFFVPLWAARRRDQRFAAISMTTLSLVGLFGYLFAPIGTVTFWSILFGFAQGGAFGLGMALISLRSREPRTAAQLSGMSQTVGYIFGGLTGPLAVGLIHDWTGGWAAEGILFVVMTIVCCSAGLGAGRAKWVDEPTTVIASKSVAAGE